jgi:hypothetical protein
MSLKVQEIFKNCQNTAYKIVFHRKATDLKSVDPKGSCGFESRHRHQEFKRRKASGLDPEAFFSFRRIKSD